MWQSTGGAGGQSQPAATIPAKPVMKFAPAPEVRLEDQGPPPAPASTYALVMLAGAVSKLFLLALPLGQLADLAFDSAPNSLTPFCAWVGLLAFAMQAYLLVSAFSDLDVIWQRFRHGKIQHGFQASYFSAGFAEFWGRWLGKRENTSFHAFVVLMILPEFKTNLWVFLWLGGNILITTLERFVGKGRPLWHWLPRPVSILITFSLVLLGWVLACSASLDHAMHYYGSLFARHELTETALINDARILSDYHLLLMIVSAIFVFAIPTLQSIVEPITQWKKALAILVLITTCAWFVSDTARTYLRSGFIQALGQGTRDVFVSRETPWLFDGRELDALTSTGALKPEITDPSGKTSQAADEVIAFAQQLKERGIPLLLIPLPMKVSLYPEYITGTDPEFSEAPLYHPCQPELYERFAKAGIDVQDVTAAFLQLKERKKQLFLKQDTHWTPDAMQELARAIAAHVKKKYPGVAAPDRLILDAKAPDAQDYGDLAQRLHQATPGAAYTPQSTVLLTFPTLENDPHSNIVLLGGDDARVFDDPTLGFVPSEQPPAQTLRASFAQHLAVYLGKPLDVYTARADATLAPRQALAQRLDNDVRAKQLVIWLLPARDLVLPPSARVQWSSVQFNVARKPSEAIAPAVR